MKAPTRVSGLHLPLAGTVAATYYNVANDACNGQRQAYGLFWKTQLCSKWKASGKCPKKDQCRFAHSQDELRDLPDLRCTKWCRRVFRGLPCEDSECPYAHSRDQLRCNSHQLLAFKTALCKFYAKGMCLSGEACRFAHTLKELRSSGAATVCVAEAEGQPSQHLFPTPQPPVRPNRSNSKASSRKNSGNSSQIYSRNRRTACCHDTCHGRGNVPQGNLECIRRSFPFEGMCADDNATGAGQRSKHTSQHITAVKMNEQTPDVSNTQRHASLIKELFRSPGRYRQPQRAVHTGQKERADKRKEDDGDDQGISTCEATEAIFGITSPSTSRTGSRSRSRSSAAAAAKAERQENIRSGDGLTHRGSQSSPQRQMKASVWEYAQSEHEEELQRATHQVPDSKDFSRKQISYSLQGELPPIPKFGVTKGAKDAPDAIEDIICPYSSHPATVSMSDLHGVTAVIIGHQTSRSYTKTQLLTVGISSKLGMHFLAGIETREASGTDDGLQDRDLTFRLVSCEENNNCQLAGESTHSQDAPARASSLHRGEAAKRSQRTWPICSALPEVTAPGPEIHQYKSCSVQSPSGATSCTSTAARFPLAAHSRFPENTSSLNSSSPHPAPALRIRRKSSARIVNTRKGRHAFRPALRSETRTPYKILGAGTKKPITRPTTSANVAPQLYPISVRSSKSVRTIPHNTRPLDSPPSIMPPAALLLYIQALEAAVVASAVCELPADEIRNTEVLSRETQLKVPRKASDVSLPSYVETWDLHAKSMALMALAALCRLALLPPQQPRSFEDHPSMPSSPPVHSIQQPLELAAPRDHFTGLTSQMDISQISADGTLLANTGLATTVEHYDVGVDDTTMIQRAFEEKTRLARPSDNPLQQQCASQEERSSLTSEVAECGETARAEQQCASGCVTDNLSVRYSPSRGCPRCLFLAALREHQPLLHHTAMSPNPPNPLENFFQRAASGCNTGVPNTTDCSVASVSEDEEQHPPPPELVASLLQYVQVASDLQQARVF